MPISISTLKSEIKAAFDAEKTQTDGQDASIDRIADRIANAVGKQIQAGIDTAMVSFVLAAPPMGGPVTGTIKIKATLS